MSRVAASVAASVAAVLVALSLSSSSGHAQQAAAPVAGPTAAADGAAQAKRGRLLYLQCRACHELQPTGTALVGPHLGGLIGRKVAGVEGFGYSQALRAQSFVWDRARLDAWLASPGKMVPGNTMAFAGIASDADRAALIAYLETATR
ncbi:MAG: c-type cytochrome [Gammaproteobacteria bacterium]